MEGSSSRRREARARRQRCSACDTGGNLHPCRGCGLAFHAEMACSGRRASRHTSGSGNSELAPGAALLCAACSNTQCPGCHSRVGSSSSVSGSSSGLEAFATGCHAASGGCGRVFHTACLATTLNLPGSTEAADTWRCEDCSSPPPPPPPPPPDAAMDSGSDGNGSAENVAPAERRTSRSSGRKENRLPLLSPAIVGRVLSRSARASLDHKSHCQPLQSRSSDRRRTITSSSSSSSQQLSILAQVPRRKDSNLSSNNDDEEGEWGPGIPSDESDDWDSKCKKCGAFGNLVCCDNCPGGKRGCTRERAGNKHMGKLVFAPLTFL